MSRWVKYFLHIDIVFDPTMIVMNNYEGKHTMLINTFIVILKQYIYMQQNVNVRVYLL